ncbi:MAG TPA: hypothetical protein ENI33_07300 [Thermoplasmatales archaeon]|nr:hypothetical protein [Thermoplasmatales archaeon]
MHDAILFCMLVSISGIILLPALIDNIVTETYIQKEEEKKADEILYQLMTCTVDKFEHLNARDILEDMGINASHILIKPIVDNLMKREQLHFTYVHLCADCLACQLKLFGYRINILTQNFTDMLKMSLKKFLDELIGNEYKYNLTIIWNPIDGFDFGGYLYVGESIPKNLDVYTSNTYLAIPPTFFTELGFSIEKIKEFILNSDLKKNFSRFENGSINKEELKSILKNILMELFNKTIWKGFDYNGDGDFIDEFEMRSLIDILVDYIFNRIYYGIEHFFDESLSIVNNIVAEGLGKYLNISLQNAFQNSLSSFVGQSTEDTIYQLLEKIKLYAKEKSKEIIEKKIHDKIEFIVEEIVEKSSVENIESYIFERFLKNINLCRAKMSLAIWRE